MKYLLLASTTISGTSGTASGKSKFARYEAGGAEGNKNGLDAFGYEAETR